MSQTKLQSRHRTLGAEWYPGGGPEHQWLLPLSLGVSGKQITMTTTGEGMPGSPVNPQVALLLSFNYLAASDSLEAWG